MEDFEVWYQRERPRVLAACVALGSELHAARDATDEAFTRAWARWPAVAAMASPGGSAQTVALNLLRRGFRRSRMARLGLSDRSGPGGEPPGLPDGDLWSAVRSLPARQQTAVVLRYVHDLSQIQIAESMGISRGTVASTLAAAHTNLRRLVPDPLMTEETIDG